jgi:DNA-binding NtrC family response regulator
VRTSTDRGSSDRREVETGLRRSSRAFIYEEDPTLRAILTEVLQDEGLVVRAFASIATLREDASKLRPAVILADTWGSSYTQLEPQSEARSLSSQLGRHSSC